MKATGRNVSGFFVSLSLKIPPLLNWGISDRHMPFRVVVPIK